MRQNYTNPALWSHEHRKNELILHQIAVSEKIYWESIKNFRGLPGDKLTILVLAH